MLKIALLFLKLFLSLVPRGKRQSLRKGIINSDQKNKGFDLKGWKYKQLVSKKYRGLTHRYFELDCRKKNAPYLILLHGMMFDGRFFINLSALAKDFNLLAYDLPENCPEYKGYLDDFNRILADLLDLKGIRCFSLLGVSFGGLLAQHFAAFQAGFQIDKLIVMSTAFYERGRKGAEKWIRVNQFVDRLSDDKLIFLVHLFQKRLSRRLRKKGEGKLLAQLRLKYPAYYRQVLSSFADYRHRADLKTLRLPLLFMLGDQDFIFSDDLEQKLARFYPDQTRLKIVNNAGHSLAFTHAEEILTELGEFLSPG